MKKILSFFFLATLSLSIYSQEFINVADINEYNEAIEKAKPGTTIILKNGVWEDVNLKAYGKGTAESPITIKARKAGDVIITGDSSLEIYGEHIVVEGLWFKDGNPTSKTIISFKKSSTEFANNCRFTNNAITYFNPNYQKFKTHWVGLWGKNNRVDHNTFIGKKNEGTTLVVWLKGDAHIENNHRIDSNLFGHRPELGRNSGETVRIGTSAYSMKSSKTIVEDNIFEKCDGELEIISNKSGDNIFRNNLFKNSKGTLTLRHGNNALVENNVFLGNNLPNTGGIRIGNKGNIVRNNLLVGIKGSSNRAPISLMNGIPNSPLNGYHQVDDTDIQNNTLIDCSTIEFGQNKSDEKALAPINTIFANNLIKNTTGSKISNLKDEIDGITFRKNVVETSGEFNRYLFKSMQLDWKDLESIPMPVGPKEYLVTDFENDKSPKKDIVGADRISHTVGAFNLDNTDLPKALKLKSGTKWKVEVKAPKFKGRRLTVEPGVGTLTQALKTASDETLMILRDGVYYVNKEQKVNGNITIKGNKNTIIKSAESLEKPFKSFFKINGNSSLNLQNVTIDGGVNTIKYAIISPSKDVADIYNLSIDNCIIKNFNHEHGYIIRAYGNTLAENVEIKNSVFSNAYRGINFHSKDNTRGIVNTKSLKIENTVFQDIESFAIKFNNPNPSSKEGELSVSNCVFSNVNNKAKGTIIESKEIPAIEIKNSVFEKSELIVNPVSLEGNKSSIKNCLVYSSGEVKVSKGAKEENIIYKNPKWKDKVNFTPKSRSPLLKGEERIGLLY